MSMLMETFGIQKMFRANWDTVWMNVALVIATRSECVRDQNGAVIIDSTNRIISSGYNGPPRGQPTGAGCQVYCERATSTAAPEHYHNCVAIHAEANALLFCDRREIEGGKLYVTSVPCFDCAKLVANSGIKRLIYLETSGKMHRNPEKTLEFFKKYGIEVTSECSYMD